MPISSLHISLCYPDCACGALFRPPLLSLGYLLVKISELTSPTADKSDASWVPPNYNKNITESDNFGNAIKITLVTIK